jgi:hypothetical protein
MEAFMKYLFIISVAALMTGCSHYSDSSVGSDSVNRQIGSKGYNHSCNAEPRNQPGCYDPSPSYSWGVVDKFKLKLGAE